MAQGKPKTSDSILFIFLIFVSLFWLADGQNTEHQGNREFSCLELVLTPFTPQTTMVLPSLIRDDPSAVDMQLPLLLPATVNKAMQSM